MRFQIVLIACWALLANAAELSDIEKMLLMASYPAETSATRAAGDEKKTGGRTCILDTGGVGRCVKESLCDLKAPPLKPDTLFTYRELEDGKCTYFQVCCPEEKIQTVPAEKPELKRSLGCGYSNPGAVLRELAGAYGYAEYSEFPWMVALLKRDAQPDALVCGGALIHPSVVVTVAHKLFGMTASELKARAGEWDMANDVEQYRPQERDARSIARHEDFDYKKSYNNVALVVVREPFVLEGAPHIGVACLQRALPPPGTQCLGMGWGKDFQKGELYANILKKLKLPLVGADQCERAYQSKVGSAFTLHNTHVCAGGVKGVDTCDGDGGSPLVCSIPAAEGQRFAVVGLVAFGLECGAGGVPGVYASVPALYDWVDREVASQGFSDKPFKY